MGFVKFVTTFPAACVSWFENSSLPTIWKVTNLVFIFNILFRFTLNKMMVTGVKRKMLLVHKVRNHNYGKSFESQIYEITIRSSVQLATAHNGATFQS